MTVPLGAWSVAPDVWFKLNYKSLTLEFEGIGIFGRIAHPGDTVDVVVMRGTERMTVKVTLGRRN